MTGNQIFTVKLRGSGGAHDTCTYQVVAPSAEKAIAKAKTQSKRDTSERYAHCVDLTHLGAAIS